MITGRSVHNQRIERLVRPIQWLHCFIQPPVFFELEEFSLLDPNKPLDLFALHYTFMPYLNQQLQSFCQIWNHHPLRSEHNRHHNSCGYQDFCLVQTTLQRKEAY